MDTAQEALSAVATKGQAANIRYLNPTDKRTQEQLRDINLDDIMNIEIDVIQIVSTKLPGPIYVRYPISLTQINTVMFNMGYEKQVELSKDWDEVADLLDAIQRYNARIEKIKTPKKIMKYKDKVRAMGVRMNNILSKDLHQELTYRCMASCIDEPKELKKYDTFVEFIESLPGNEKDSFIQLMVELMDIPDTTIIKNSQSTQQSKT